MLNKRGLFFLFFGIALCFCAMTSAAQAQATRTWVSGVGDDANPCSRTAPCKTWAGAISKTAAGGEMDALDPGGFGGLTITKAIMIDGGGGQVASVLVSGTPGITVNAGVNDRIVLRNLRINGIIGTGSPGTTGINFIAGLSLTVQNCVIQGFSGYGIDFEPVVRSFLTVTDTIIDWNGTVANPATGGIKSATTATTGGQNKVSIKNTTVSNNVSGIFAGINTKMQLDHVIVDASGVGGGDYGLIANGTAAEINADYSSITNNNAGGLHSTAGGLMRISNSSITGNNQNGILIDPGSTISSYGNNRVNGNVGAQAFSAPLLPQI